MPNIPKQFTQEAQDERDSKRRLTSPKSRAHWSFSDVEQDDWDAIFGRVETESK